MIAPFFEVSRHNCAMNKSLTFELLVLIRAAKQGLAMADTQASRPGLARRTAQRHLAKGIQSGILVGQGEGRGRRYLLADRGSYGSTVPKALLLQETPDKAPAFPSWIPLSLDSLDVLRYVDQDLGARKPVGYQHEFLAAYEPGRTWYLSEPLRRQLHKMGKTSAVNAPAGTYSRAILNRLLIDLSWASSHLEGNTYSRLDTLQLIQHGQVAQGKAALETQMILNHRAAIELLVNNIDTVGLNRYTLMNIHSALSENLLPDQEDEGRVRQHAVHIGQSVYRPLSGSAQLEAGLDMLLQKVGLIPDPFEQSFFMMVHLPYLQPFADMNKRSSRLAANLPLFRANLCPLTFLDVPEQAYSRATLGVYEMTRVELLRDLYTWAYQRSTHEYSSIQQNLTEPDPHRLKWRNFIKQCVREAVQQPLLDPLKHVQTQVALHIPQDEQAPVFALLVNELGRLHEGVLARYGLKPSEFALWKARSE